jgi:hypothetical protein
LAFDRPPGPIDQHGQVIVGHPSDATSGRYSAGRPCRRLTFADLRRASDFADNDPDIARAALIAPGTLLVVGLAGGLLIVRLWRRRQSMAGGDMVAGPHPTFIARSRLAYLMLASGPLASLPLVLLWWLKGASSRSSRGVAVFVNESAEYVNPLDRGLGGGRGLHEGQPADPDGRLQIEAAMRPNAVVVAQVLDEHAAQVVLVPDQCPVQTLRPHNAHHRSAKAFTRGARGGSSGSRYPPAANTVSNAAVNFVSRSRIKNRKQSTRSSRSISRLRACCATHMPVGWAVIPMPQVASAS